MKYIVSVCLAAALFGLSAVSNAHQQRIFDAGKKAAFEQIAATSKTRAVSYKKANKTAARCIQGMADGQYPCKNIDMLAFIDIGTLGVSFVNDMWGWSDPWTGREFALVGASEGTIAIDITNPRRPWIVGMLPTASTEGGAFWRDIKVYDHHAYIISEHDNHGMQVMDLRQLRKIKRRHAPVDLVQVAQYDEFSTSHNIVINEETGFAYVVGADTCMGGLEIIDINHPANPVSTGCFDQHGYVHDAQCVVYKGPDREHRRKEVCFNASANSGAPFFNTLSIVDVTDKSNPTSIVNKEYGSGFGYSHQGWLLPNQKYFIHDDELDEYFGDVSTTTTRLWDVRNLDDPKLIAETTNGATSIDHNLYTKGRYSYASNYTSGLRVFDTRKVHKGEYEEVAYFDMYPENDNPTFEGGTWSNYPYFWWNDGVVGVTSMDRGFYLLKPRLRRGRSNY